MRACNRTPKRPFLLQAETSGGCFPVKTHAPALYYNISNYVETDCTVVRFKSIYDGGLVRTPEI